MSSKCKLEAGPRKTIPNWIDSINKQWKYVDPGHRYCVPGFKAASFTPMNKADKYNGRTHNCYVACITNNGDHYAFRHPHRMTGYKAPNAYGKAPLFDGLTTNHYFDRFVRHAGEEVDYMTKKLRPYRVMALRNRPRDQFRIDVGMRSFDRRNASYLMLETGDPRHKKTPISTHQNFHRLPKITTGMSNPGILADKTVLIHKHQLGD